MWDHGACLGADRKSIAVYDVLLPLSPPHSSPILLPQPPAHFPSLISSSPHAHPGRNKAPSTYIGAVPFPFSLPKSTGSPEGKSAQSTTPSGGTQQRDTQAKSLLYALSSTSYPLINLAPPPRPGTLTNGSFLLTEDVPERDQLLPYLIDPPSEEEEKGLIVPGVSGMVATQEEGKDPVESHARGGSVKLYKWAITIIGGIAGTYLSMVLLRKRMLASRTAPGDDEKSPLSAISISTETDLPPLPSVPIVPTSHLSAVSTLPGTPLTVSPPVSDNGETPKKKSTRRRVRGKKKRSASNAAILEVDEDGEGEEADMENQKGAGGVGLIVGDGAGVDWRERKPLPELPRDISTVGLEDEGHKERLAISDTVIGEPVSRSH
jgi:serine/threonine-protein kinase/endoribonuclease IRE1